jgi:secreted trypsin-like serine protease
MCKSALVVVVVVVLALLVAVPVSAITYGELDGNRHPNIGTMVFESNGVKTKWCTGTLISPTVFLTAGHCAAYLGWPEGMQIWVTFDSVFDPNQVQLIAGTLHLNPDYGYSGAGGKSDPHDLAVVVLDEPAANKYPGIKPAALPTAHLFDQMAVHNGLKGQQFTAVGYGTLAPTPGGGPMTFPPSDERRFSIGSFDALNNAWLHLSANDATGDGGTCYGDSGGPNFLGAGSGETNIIAGITVTGDMKCFATNVTYRLDTASAREFLADYVTLP